MCTGIECLQYKWLLNLLYNKVVVAGKVFWQQNGVVTLGEAIKIKTLKYYLLIYLPKNLSPKDSS